MYLLLLVRLRYGQARSRIKTAGLSNCLAANITTLSSSLSTPLALKPTIQTLSVLMSTSYSKVDLAGPALE